MSAAVEQALLVVRAALEQHEQHGWGEVSVKTTPEAVTVCNGVIVRIPKPAEKKT